MIPKRAIAKPNPQIYAIGVELERLVIQYQNTPNKEVFKKISDTLTPLHLKIARFLHFKYNCPFGIQLAEITLKQLCERYKPKNNNSLFLGYLKRTWYWYTLTNLRKTEKRDKIKRENADPCFRNGITHKKYLNILNRHLAPRQRQVILDYFTLCLTHRAIARKYKISPTTVRNIKRVGLQKIRAVNTQIYNQLLDMQVNSDIKSL